jgi:hypothetical protein
MLPSQYDIKIGILLLKSVWHFYIFATLQWAVKDVWLWQIKLCFKDHLDYGYWSYYNMKKAEASK